MAWKDACELAELQQLQRKTTILDGHKILLIWHKDSVRAVAAQCPHFKLPLAKGSITEQDTLICPFHKSEFDLTTGQVNCWAPWPRVLSAVLAKMSKPKNLKIYPTRVEQGRIAVDI